MIFSIDWEGGGVERGWFTIKLRILPCILLGLLLISSSRAVSDTFQSANLLDTPLVLTGEESKGADPRAVLEIEVEAVAEREPLLVLWGRSSSLSEESKATVREPSIPASFPPSEVPELMLPAFKKGSVTI